MHYTAKWFPFQWQTLAASARITMLPSLSVGGWGFACIVTELATVPEAYQLYISEGSGEGRTSALNHSLGCLCNSNMHVRVCMFVRMRVAGTQQQSHVRSSDEAPLELGLETMTLGNVVPPTGFLAFDTQSHRSGGHRCTVDL